MTVYTMTQQMKPYLPNYGETPRLKFVDDMCGKISFQRTPWVNTEDGKATHCVVRINENIREMARAFRNTEFRNFALVSSNRHSCLESSKLTIFTTSENYKKLLKVIYANLPLSEKDKENIQNFLSEKQEIIVQKWLEKAPPTEEQKAVNLDDFYKKGHELAKIPEVAKLLNTTSQKSAYSDRPAVSYFPAAVQGMLEKLKAKGQTPEVDRLRLIVARFAKKHMELPTIEQMNRDLKNANCEDLAEYFQSYNFYRTTK